MGVHLYTNGAWTDSGWIYRNSLNLFDIALVEQGGYNAPAGSIIEKTLSTTRCRYNQTIPLPADTLSLTCPSNIKINYIWIDNNGLSLGGSGFQRNGDTATAPENAVSMTFLMGLDGDIQCTTSDFHDVCIVSGATPIPYEPYNIVDWYTNNGHGYTSGAWS